jgi:hypothetical protein
MQTDTQVPPVSKKVIWTGRIISALPVLMMVFSGTMKLMKGPGVVKAFGDLGYQPYLIVPLGFVEIGCVILYLIPRTSVLGAIFMTGYLGGAVATHARMSDPMFVAPFILGTLVWLGLLLREPRLRPLLPLRNY